MRVVTAPEMLIQKPGERSLFMAGNITGCSDWQSIFINLLVDTPVVLLNPRRKNFPINNPAAAEEQITWEWHGFRSVESSIFWFAPETVGPIVLFELGVQLTLGREIMVGVHPDYPRRKDVEIQLRLANPRLKIVYSLADLATEVKKWVAKGV